jgi:hypothetical protein
VSLDGSTLRFALAASVYLSPTYFRYAPTQSVAMAFCASRSEISPLQIVVAAARDLHLTESSLRNWVEQARADRGTGKPGALTTAEREELAGLRKENRPPPQNLWVTSDRGVGVLAIVFETREDDEKGLW